MRHARVLAVSALVIPLIAVVAFAQSSVTPVPDNAPVQTESAIRPGLFRDYYVALGEPLGTDGTWSVRLDIKPFVRCIWLGGLFMLLGGLTAAADRRFRRIGEAAERTPAAAVAGPAATADPAHA